MPAPDQTSAQIFTLFVELCAHESAGDRELFFLEHPVVASQRALDALGPDGENVPAPSADFPARAQRAWRELQHFAEAVRAVPRSYPVGSGPIEQLWTRVYRGELRRDVALGMAKAPELTALLSPEYVKGMGVYARRTASEGALDAGLLVFDLLRAAAGAASGPEALDLRIIAESEWLAAAGAVLVQVADGGVYADACAAGNWLIATAQERKDWPLLTRSEHGIGVLHLDPYVAFENPANADIKFAKWLRKSAERLGGAARVEGFPPPRQALSIAEAHLRRALEHATGYNRRVATKALIQTLSARGMLGEVVDEKEIGALASEALSANDPMEDPQRWLQFAARVAAQGGALPEAKIAALLDVPLEEWVRRFNAPEAARIARSMLIVLRQRDPRRALELAALAGPLFSEMPLEAEQLLSLDVEVSLFAAFAGPRESPDADTDFGAAGAALLARVEEPERTAAALIALALDARPLNQEVAALALVDQAETRAPELAARHQRALTYLRLNLWMGIASNHMFLRNPKELNRAAGAYAEALALSLQLRCPDKALELLVLLQDLASRKDPAVVAPILLALLHLGLRCELAVGAAAAVLIGRICRKLTVLLTPGDGANLFPVVWQVAKGMRWAVTLAEGYGSRPGADEQVQRILSEIAEARRAAGEGADVDRYPEGGSPEFEAWLTTYARAERYDGDQEWERIANRKMTLDERVATLTAPPEPAARLSPLGLGEVQAALGPETALLLMYIGELEDGLPAVYSQLITRESCKSVARAPAVEGAELPMTDGERKGHFSVFAPRVQELRRLIQTEPPADLVVTPEAGEGLRGTLSFLFGPLDDDLATLHRQGKNHLLVAPHDAFHFLPFHLLGPPGEPLAEQWTITYLPNLALLAPSRGPLENAQEPRPDRGASIGLGFAGDPGGWPAIEDAVVEAKEVAKILGQSAILDEEATKDAVIEALARSRTVHIASHGAIDVDAPAFQMVVLHPPENEDQGRLFAHEILDIDLSGLEIVTLSACETSLARVDRSDNLRGLAPALFSAGVATVVGTLWRVSSPAAQVFFTAFYRELKRTGRRLEAFRGAQRETRSVFPQYRDWGAFYLQGNWR